MTNKEPTLNHLFTAIAQAIQQAHQQVRQAVNQQMVLAYWKIGRLIVEQEQQGQQRADLPYLSKTLQTA